MITVYKIIITIINIIIILINSIMKLGINSILLCRNRISLLICNLISFETIKIKRIVIFLNFFHNFKQFFSSLRKHLVRIILVL